MTFETDLDQDVKDPADQGESPAAAPVMISGAGADPAAPEIVLQVRDDGRGDEPDPDPGPAAAPDALAYDVVTGVNPDGSVNVDGPAGPRTLRPGESPEVLLRYLQAQSDPLGADGIAAALRDADQRGLIASNGPDGALAIYEQAVQAYRGVMSTAGTIVRFLHQSGPAARRALQDEAAMVLGLEAALEPGGILWSQRVWLDGMTLLLHYLELRAPEEFGGPESADRGRCFCLVHIANRIADPDIMRKIFGGDGEALLDQATESGLAVFPARISDYLAHRGMCPRALVEDVPCACGLDELLTTAA